MGTELQVGTTLSVPPENISNIIKKPAEILMEFLIFNRGQGIHKNQDYFLMVMGIKLWASILE